MILPIQKMEREAQSKSMNSTQKTKRYSVRCSLCKSRFMTELSDEQTASKHAETCERFKETLRLRIERTTRYRATWKMECNKNPANIAAHELHQMRALYLQFDRVKGFTVPSVPCDARCTGARGHNCECSCGGANHGADNAIGHGMSAPKIQEVA